MFEQSILKGATKTRRAWTVMASFLGQTLFLGIAILLPLIAFDRLPQVRLTPPLLAPPPPPRPPDLGTRPHVRVVAVIRGRTPRPFTAPACTPRTIATTVATPEPPAELQVAENASYVPFSPGAGQYGVPRSPGSAPWQVPTPTPPPPPRHDPKLVDRPSDPVPIGGRVMMAKLTHQVTPAYPPLARQARVEGTVQLQAFIGRDGRIRDLRVTSGHPLLIQAAVDAVRQWIYRPTTLNGSPVEVLTTVDVNFTLKR
jgi:periplasmic protein TonB